ncbi:hypothetical protein Pla52n_09350 [Stieleria varia]|uniref:Uncharacterized protein n=1 Tax=Stieleria varia TaxID=2528005 RepID=A0A5C6B8E5_9BACT|nr:hypothetical protein Pla52n_09350 [Stieleria varia]
MGDSATSRVWKRFLKAQSAIRTALAAICPPPRQATACGDRLAALATIAHLKEAFKASTLNLIAAYQTHTQSFF